MLDVISFKRVKHTVTPYLSSAGSFAVSVCGHSAPSLTAASSSSADASLMSTVRVCYRPVAIATSRIVPINDVPVAIGAVAVVSMAVVAICYFVINQGSILILAELANQLGFQS